VKGPGEFIHRHLGISVIAFEELVVQQMEKIDQSRILAARDRDSLEPAMRGGGVYRVPGNMKHNMQEMRRHDQTDDNDA
jgi:hypothetical protein